MQVYRGMDIGTAKPTAEERHTHIHHLLDLVSPEEHFHAEAWAEKARVLIADLERRERLPIIVGGTGLYFRALVRGFFKAPRPDPEIRSRHQREAVELGVDGLYRRLESIDPVAAAKILPGDLFRISRALEVFEQTGIPISELRRLQPSSPPLRLFSILLDFSMDELRVRIRQRVDAMMETGFLDEVRALRTAGFGSTRAMQSLGYKQLGQHLDGTLRLEEAVDSTKSATVAYARRQRTWFRSESICFRTQQSPDATALARLVSGWLLV
jgi:tRNA dimethylallyltransferase